MNTIEGRCLARLKYSIIVNRNDCKNTVGHKQRRILKNLQVIEKLLNLDRGGTLHDLVIRFGCPEAKDPAQQILTRLTANSYYSIHYYNARVHLAISNILQVSTHWEYINRLISIQLCTRLQLFLLPAGNLIGSWGEWAWFY